MAAPASYEDTLRRHDVAFYKWLGGLRVDYGAPADFPTDFPFVTSYPTRQNFPILRTQATRERAFATVVDLLVSMGWINSGTADQIRQKAGDFAVLPLPVAVIERGDYEIDTQAASVPKRFFRSYFNQATLKWESHPWPATYFLPYRVTFWCSKRYTEAFMREWVMAQLGKLGAADNEVLIQVEHREPWGTQWQKLQYESSSDLSDLEGDLPRAIRYELSFRLRMLHFRPNIESNDPVNAVQTPIHLGQIGDVPGADPFATVADEPNDPQTSDNLYLQYYSGDEIARSWPRDGLATANSANVYPPGGDISRVVRANLRAVTDHVGIANRPVYLGASPSNVAIMSVSARYTATAEVAIRTWQRAGTESPTAWSSARSVTLPPTWPTFWRDFQFFTLLDQPIFSLEWEGRAIQSTVHFTDVSVKHIYSRTRLSPSGSSAAPFSTTLHTWNGMTIHQSYLVVVIPATYSGQWTIRVADDEQSPQHIITRTFDAATERGFVELIQPKSGSIALTLPADMAPAAVFVQPYFGVFSARLP